MLIEDEYMHYCPHTPLRLQIRRYSFVLYRRKSQIIHAKCNWGGVGFKIVNCLQFN